MGPTAGCARVVRLLSLSTLRVWLRVLFRKGDVWFCSGVMSAPRPVGRTFVDQSISTGSEFPGKSTGTSRDRGYSDMHSTGCSSTRERETENEKDNIWLDDVC